MRFPWTQANPAELSFTVLVPTDHVVAATIFLNGHVAFWTLLLAGRRLRLRKYTKSNTKVYINRLLVRLTTLKQFIHIPKRYIKLSPRVPQYLRVCRNPVRSFTVIIAFLDPLPQPLHKIEMITLTGKLLKDLYSV